MQRALHIHPCLKASISLCYLKQQSVNTNTLSEHSYTTVQWSGLVHNCRPVQIVSSNGASPHFCSVKQLQAVATLQGETEKLNVKSDEKVI